MYLKQQQNPKTNNNKYLKTLNKNKSIQKNKTKPNF